MRTLALSVAVVFIAFGSALAEDREACQKRWLEAEAGGIVKGAGVVSGRVTVVVNETVYSAIDFDVKLGMARTFECAVAGPGKSLVAVDFVSHRTNKRLASWSYGKLTVD